MDRKEILKRIELQIISEELRPISLERDGALDALHLAAHYLELKDHDADAEATDPGLPTSYQKAEPFRLSTHEIEKLLSAHRSDILKDGLCSHRDDILKAHRDDILKGQEEQGCAIENPPYQHYYSGFLKGLLFSIKKI